MQEGENCIGCSSRRVEITEEEIKKIFSKTIKIKGVKLVSEETYRQRIEKCKSCEYLEFGTTCRQCGCIVEIKAKLEGASCPYPYNSKW